METHENEPSYTKADVGDPVHHLWVCSRETMRTKQRRIAKYLASGSQIGGKRRREGPATARGHCGCPRACLSRFPY